MPDTTGSQPPKLLDEVRTVLRLHHYSIHTERAYVDWIIRFVRFHGMQTRPDLFPAEPKIEAFLTDLAVRANVAASTQNQAMNALVFLYKRVLSHETEARIDAVRAPRKVNVPVVMTREEVAAVLSLMDGTAQLVAKLLCGSGLRTDEATVRAGGEGRQGLPLIQSAGPEVLQNDICAPRQLTKNFLAARQMEVQGERFLVAIDTQERRAGILATWAGLLDKIRLSSCAAPWESRWSSQPPLLDPSSP